MLKLKAITNIAIRLTNQKNETIDLNGLDFDISLKLEFIEDKTLKQPRNVREVLYEESQKYLDRQALAEIERDKQQKKLKEKTQKRAKKKK